MVFWNWVIILDLQLSSHREGSFCLVVVPESRWGMNEDNKYWIIWEARMWRTRGGGEELNLMDKEGIKINFKIGNFWVALPFRKEPLKWERLEIYFLSKQYSKGLPVIFDRVSSSLAAEGPRAMVWMIAPLCLTSSKHELIASSSPSVSNMISEPEVLWLLLVIAWMVKSQVLNYRMSFLNTFKLRTNLFSSLREVFSLMHRSKPEEIFCIIVPAWVVYGNDCNG